jgi:hypothetical protein
MGKTVTLKGFARVKVAEDGKIVGDSGWVQNLITDYGLDDCIGQGIVGGGTVVSAIALGTGSAPASNDGTAVLDGEVMGTGAGAVRQAHTGGVVSASDGVTLQFLASFSSADRNSSFDISNIGLYSNTSGTGLMAGTTYASSNIETNQDVYASYNWEFATA